MRDRSNILVYAAAAVAAWFLYGFALNYLGGDPGRFGIYFPRREWLTTHILAGCAAILLGPLQLWLGFNRGHSIYHRIFGIAYVTAVGCGGVAAFYLAFHTDFGWVFGMGFTSMGLAWVVTTALATISICRRLVEQHREWMIRSYVVTFSFVTFRVLTIVFEMIKAGTLVERMSAASWLAWSVPLLITETILQGQKIFATTATAVPLQDANVYSASPEPLAFDLQSSESSYLHRP
jgi:hypothetical protein